MLLFTVQVNSSRQPVSIIIAVGGKTVDQILPVQSSLIDNAVSLAHHEKGILVLQNLVHSVQIFRRFQLLRLRPRHLPDFFLRIYGEAIEHLHGISRQQIYLLAQAVGFLERTNLIIAQSRNRRIDEENRHHCNCDKGNSQTRFDLHTFSFTKI